jgi:hypothetical protein
MGLTSLALAYGVDVSLTNEAGIRLEIPDTVGAWTGAEILYCQNPDCRELVEVDDAAARPAVCPECGEGVLDPMSMLEKELLPSDTGMIRKQFLDPEGARVHASIVLSGKERGSIHRPELCLTGQGRKITGRRVVEVPMEGRVPLRVMVLELEITTAGPTGAPFVSGAYYAYWFVGKGRETPHHLMRMALMAADRVFRNVAHRWAYVSVSGTRNPGSDAYLDEVRGFVHDFYPGILLAE